MRKVLKEGKKTARRDDLSDFHRKIFLIIYEFLSRVAIASNKSLKLGPNKIKMATTSANISFPALKKKISESFFITFFQVCG